MGETGYIKYNCTWIKSEPLPEPQITTLNRWRARLYDLKLIGVNPDGIGYGNISQRIEDSNQFIVTGSSTGHLAVLDGRHYTRVISFDFARNKLTCQGPIQASSESLTHAAIYITDPQVKGVIHIHSLDLWQKLIDHVPTTSKDVEYGTPEMAVEMIRVIRSGSAADSGIIVMGGHKEGLVTFGATLDQAGERILQICSDKFIGLR